MWGYACGRNEDGGREAALSVFRNTWMSPAITALLLSSNRSLWCTPGTQEPVRQQSICCQKHEMGRIDGTSSVTGLTAGKTLSVGVGDRTETTGGCTSHSVLARRSTRRNI